MKLINVPPGRAGEPAPESGSDRAPCRAGFPASRFSAPPPTPRRRTLCFHNIYSSDPGSTPTRNPGASSSVERRLFECRLAGASVFPLRAAEWQRRQPSGRPARHPSCGPEGAPLGVRGLFQEASQVRRSGTSTGPPRQQLAAERPDATMKPTGPPQGDTSVLRPWPPRPFWEVTMWP